MLVAASEGIDHGIRCRVTHPTSAHDVASGIPIEHLTLLGDLDFSGEGSRRLSNNGSMRGATAAPYCSSTPMEEPQLDIELLRGFVQRAVGLVQFPRTGEHASILVGIRVTQHDVLAASP